MAFPISPAIGDTFVQGNVEYKWNGVAWDVNGSTGFDILADYAKKVGDNTQTFKVADAVNADEAMTLGQLTKSRVDALNVDADTVDGVQGALLGIGGAGYAWVDETANRVLGTTYTNTYGKPIMVAISLRVDANSYSNSKIYIDGIAFDFGVMDSSAYPRNSISFVIPGSSTYKLDGGTLSTPIIVTWLELK